MHPLGKYLRGLELRRLKCVWREVRLKWELRGGLDRSSDFNGVSLASSGLRWSVLLSLCLRPRIDIDDLKLFLRVSHQLMGVQSHDLVNEVWVINPTGTMKRSAALYVE